MFFESLKRNKNSFHSNRGPLLDVGHKSMWAAFMGPRYVVLDPLYEVKAKVRHLTIENNMRSKCLFSYFCVLQIFLHFSYIANR